MNDEKIYCIEIPSGNEPLQRPAECIDAPRSDTETSAQNENLKPSFSEIPIAEHVAEEGTLKVIPMDVDIDACERSVSRKEFLETNNRVFSFCGLILNKNCKMALFLTLPLITVVPTLFWYFNLQDEELWLRIGSGILFLMPATFMLFTFLREPGYIPRVVNNPHSEIEGQASCEVNGVLYKWCHTCHIWRPPRSKHCVQMDACVHLFDHYCPWLGNAIGARNYIPFYMFLLTSATALIIAITEAFLLNPKNKNDVIRTIVFWIVVMFGLFFALFITLQCLHNTYNLYNGKTTQEFFLKRVGSSKKGIIANLRFFCPPRPSQLE